MVTDNRDISEFNGAQLKLFRIDEIIRGINQCRHELNLQQWLFFLQDFDMELESVKTVDEKVALKKELETVEEKINIQLKKTTNPYGKKLGIPQDVIQELNNYQKSLLTIFKKSGLELKLQQDAMSGMGRRG